MKATIANEQTSLSSHGPSSQRPLVALIAALLAPVGSAWALPNGEQVVAGSATVARPTAQSMTVNQSSSKAIVNWQGFSIAAPESVTFQQPGRSSVILNRVVGQDASQIAGRMQANGNVFLVNPNGVLFTKGATVDVGGLVASTLDISNENFLSGRYEFKALGGATGGANGRGAVINAGVLNAAEGGTVALLGGQVQNDGTITAKLGTVALAAGNGVSLDFAGDGLTKVTVTEGALAAEVQNRGAVIADGGQAILTARAADALTRSVVNHSGVVRARTLVERGGLIVLESGSEGTTEVTGALDASAPDAPATGGAIRVLGNDVRLTGPAHADASGGAGGGAVLIGGDFQGRNPEIPSARSTTIGSDVTVTADALSKGHGGRVIAWSTGETKVHGALRAHGGPLGGDGGLIETSGASLDLAGAHVSAGATAGRPGVWLLDPQDIFIDSSQAQTISNSLDNTDVVVETADAGEGLGNISVGASISKDGGPGSTTSLRLLAHGAVSFFGGGGGDLNGNGGTLEIKSTTGPLNIEVVSRKTDGDGWITLGSGTQFRTNGGRVVLTGGSDGLASLAQGAVQGAAAGICGEGCAAGVDVFGATIDTRGPGALAGHITLRGNGSEGPGPGIVIDRSAIIGRSITVVGNGAGTGTGVAITDSTLRVTEGDLVVSGTGEAGRGVDIGSGALLTSIGPAGSVIDVRGDTSSGVTGLRIEGDVGGPEVAANILLASNRTVDVSGLAGRKIQTRGTIALRPSAGNLGIQVNASVLAVFAPGEGGVVLGSDAQTGPITVVAPVELPFSLTLQQAATNAEGIAVNQPLSASGHTVALISGGPITQSAPVTAQNLLLSSGSGDLSFTNTGNNVQRVSISALGGDATFVNGGQAGTGGAGNGNGASVNGGTLTLGPVSARVFSSSSGGVSTTTLANSVSQGDFFVRNLSGDLTLAQSIRTLGSDITLVTPGVFDNAGNGQLSPGGSGRWSVWASTWTGENRGGLVPSSPRPNIYGCTYAGPCTSGAAIPATGNHFFYQERPTLTFTTPDQQRIYGEANPVFPVTSLNGLLTQLGDTQADALQGAFSTTATVSSDVGTYPIVGSFTSPVGYVLPAPDGNVYATLTIGQAGPLLYVANPASREYGLGNPPFSGTVTGFRPGDTQASATTGTLVFTSPATAGSPVGRYAINGSGLSARNYRLEQAPENATSLTVTPATLTYVANPATREYGVDNPSFGGAVAGFRLEETLANATRGTLVFSSTATAGSPVGGYAINGSGLSATNYNFVQSPQNATALTIIKAPPLTYVADPTLREYGLPNPTLTGTVTGFRNNDNLASATTGTLVFSSPATRLSIPGSYPILGSGIQAANYHDPVQALGNATALTVTAEGTLFQASSSIPTLDRTPGLRDTNVYSSGFLLPSMCLASEPIIGSSGLAPAGDILEVEWARVRLRPNLSNCVSVGDRDYCRDF